MAKVKLTITESRCRSGYHRKGQEFIIDENVLKWSLDKYYSE